MTDIRLGTLARVDLRDIWASEASDFTPWLARVENLAILGETLGFDLELEAQEKAVGPFRADLLCKDLGSNAWVLIENQLERTDHRHLGQLLTYASGLEAVTLIWIAATFTDEHRATLDWLNRITDERFRFFGLEVELWKIGTSPAAPKFNVISQPNNWSRSVARAARALDETELSETRILQLEYWTAFHDVLDRKGGPVSGRRKPQANSWMAYAIGRSGSNLEAAMLRRKKQLRAGLYIGSAQSKQLFQLLLPQRTDIEAAFGAPLAWDNPTDRKDCRVSICLDAADPEDRDDWPRQHDWLADMLNRLHGTFSNRVAALDPSDREDEAGS